VLGAVVAAAALLAACGGDDDGGSTSTATVAAPTADASRTASAAPASATASGADGSPTVAPTATNRGPSADAFRAIDYPDDLTDGFSLGRADAKVVLTVFEDFQCPFCLLFTVVSEPTILTEYVFKGTVRLEFRNLPILGKESANAAIAAQCAADQDRFWPYAKALFLVQHDAGQLTKEALDVGRFNPDPLIALAEGAGADETAFEACVFSQAAADAVTEHLREANSLGLRSTPSILVNGVHEPRVPADAQAWREYLNAKLRES